MTIRNLKTLAVATMLFGGTVLTLAAQSTTQGAITGTVFDATNAAIPGATIVIHNDGTNAELKLTKQ